MLAGTSPFAGVNIGKGLLAGTETLSKQREASREEESVNQRAKQLALQADQHLREYTQLKPGEAGRLEQGQAALEQNKWQLVTDPQSGQAFWSKQGENPIPALPQ